MAWHKAKLKNPNWWWNEIGVPIQAASILASRPDLKTKLKAALLEWIGKPLTEGEIASTFTGQSLAWRARIALIAGAASKNKHDMQAAVNEAPLKISDDEGLQADKWHQHRQAVHDRQLWL